MKRENYLIEINTVEMYIGPGFFPFKFPDWTFVLICIEKVGLDGDESIMKTILTTFKNTPFY